MLEASQTDTRPALLLTVGRATYFSFVGHAEQKPAALRVSEIRFVAKRGEVPAEFLKVEALFGLLVLNHLGLHVSKQGTNKRWHF